MRPSGSRRFLRRSQQAGVIFTARCGCRQNSGFVRQTAAELGLRWWDVLEDCADGQISPVTCAQGCQHSGTCASSDGAADVRSACVNGQGRLGGATAYCLRRRGRMFLVYAALHTAGGAPIAAQAAAETAYGYAVSRGQRSLNSCFSFQVAADFEKNWKNPIGRALDDMRVWNSTRGGLWIRNQSLLA